MLRTLTAVALIATSTMAYAATDTDALREMVGMELEKHDIEYDVSTISDEDLRSIENILNGGDDAMAKKSAIRAILGLN